VRLAGKPPAGTGHFKWLLDTASARVIAGIGTFERVWWARDSDDQKWVADAFADVPNIGINIETYPATGQAVYLIDQGKVPGAAVDRARRLPAIVRRARGATPRSRLPDLADRGLRSSTATSSRRSSRPITCASRSTPTQRSRDAADQLGRRRVPDPAT
jgi:hypothetical protein